MSNLVVIGVFFVGIFLFLVFGCPLIHLVKKNCALLRQSRRRRGDRYSEEVFYQPSHVLPDPDAYRQNERASSRRRHKSDSRDRGLPQYRIPETALLQALRPAALANFQLFDNPQNLPPEILSQQSLQVSPDLVQNVYSKLSEKVATKGESSKPAAPPVVKQVAKSQEYHDSLVPVKGIPQPSGIIISGSIDRPSLDAAAVAPPENRYRIYDSKQKRVPGKSKSRKKESREGRSVVVEVDPGYDSRISRESPTAPFSALCVTEV